jgi:catecholate siderophore receptor
MNQSLVRQPLRLRSLAANPASNTLQRTTVAMSVSAAMLLLPLAAVAQTATAGPDGAKVRELGEVVVLGKRVESNPNAEVGAPYKAKTSGDARHTRPLAETPSTITVLTKSAIDDAGVTDLKQILAAQPGITLGTGENGNAFGDRYIIRGQEARSDVFVDGLRDPGMSTRESFAIEQLEISKGPNSSFAGRGTAGGAINAITKQATLDHDFTRVSIGAGTDSQKRVTTDINKGFGDNVAVRVNALYGDEYVPNLKPAERERKGVALSGLYEVNKDLSITLDYYGLRTDDKSPDLGTYLVGALPYRVAAQNTPAYGQASDFLKSDIDTATARINWKLAPNMRLTSLTRYGTSNNSYVTTGATSGTRYDGPTGRAYTTGYLDTGHTGWQDVNYFAHQSNLRVDTTLGGMKNELIFGVEYTNHKVTSGNFTVANTAANANCKTNAGIGANNGYCLTTYGGTPVANLANLAGRSATRNNKNQDWRVKTAALTVMDTIDLTDKFSAFGGIRADRFDLDLVRFTPATGAVTGDYGYKDTLVNGHFGLTYKAAKDLIVYASAATAQDINGGEADSGTNSGYGGAVLYQGQVAGAKPETSTNYEIGTKWDLLDHQLLATAALFQTTKKDVMEGANYDTLGTFNTGKNRVHGFEMGISGDFSDKFSMQAGAAVMKSKVLGSATAANIGNPLSNFAEKSYSVQAKYQLTDAFSFGAINRYESNRCGGQPDTGAGFSNGMCSQPVPSFQVTDLFAAYRFNKKFDMRVNVLNAFDKTYYTAVYRAGFFMYRGDARSVRVTLNYEM